MMSRVAPGIGKVVESAGGDPVLGRPAGRGLADGPNVTSKSRLAPDHVNVPIPTPYSLLVDRTCIDDPAAAQELLAAVLKGGQKREADEIAGSDKATTALLQASPFDS